MLSGGACHLDCRFCIRLLLSNGEIFAEVRGPFTSGRKGQNVFRVRACFGELVLDVLIHTYRWLFGFCRACRLGEVWHQWTKRRPVAIR